MSFEQQINDDLKEAMKAKQTATVRTLRAVKSAILLAKTSEGASGDVSEEEGQKILRKQLKQRQDSLDIFSKQNRDDLAATEAEEIKVLQKYLPAQMSEDNVRAVVKGIIEKSGASGPSEMGKVMGPAMAALNGKADGKMISTLVREMLG
ncbi:MAG: hypothetical protein ACI959_000023 [Limisphaerales bacterium]|jgi:uncharacterized protein YqeY